MLGNKIKQLRSERGITQGELAKVLGVSASTIGMYEQNRREPDIATLNKLSKYFHVSIDYLLDKTDIPIPYSGDYLEYEDVFYGMLKKNGYDYKKTAREYYAFESDVSKQDPSEPATAEEDFADIAMQSKAKKLLTRLPLYNIPVSAGAGQWLSSGREYEYEDFEDVPESADLALRVRGDSMEPMYFDNDIVFVKANVLVESGQIGVFCLNNEGFLKMLQGNRLVSLNPKYEAKTIGEYDSFFCVGRVIGKAQKKE